MQIYRRCNIFSKGGGFEKEGSGWGDEISSYPEVQHLEKDKASSSFLLAVKCIQCVFLEGQHVWEGIYAHACLGHSYVTKKEAAVKSLEKRGCPSKST